MPVIQISLLKGRTVEQKEKLAEEITNVVEQIAKAKRSQIKIIYYEIEKEDLADGGILAKYW